MTDLPIVIGPAGLVPAQPSAVLQQLISSVIATNPGYTAKLPGSLVEDISSTDVAAILQCDSALVEFLNSLTPLGCNAFVLSLLGQVYGVPIGGPSNTSVYVVFSGPPGFVIGKGFTVSDGTYQYIVQNGGIIESNGSSAPLFTVATVPGSWAIPEGTVVNLITSVPSTISLTVTNPGTGIPGTAAQSETSYRSQVLQAGLAASQGMSRYLKTILGQVPGTQQNLISARLVGTLWEIIVGGGDPYAVAYAIMEALGSGINSLTGSVIGITGITKANPGVITTNLNHGYITGAVVTPFDIGGMTALNGVPLTIIVLTEKTFSIGVDTTSYTTYTSGGYVTPNNRNVVVSVYDYPDTYSIPIVIPPEQKVSIVVTWNTTATNFISDVAIAQLAIPALVDYINNIAVGQPINQFELVAVFQAAVAPNLPLALLTRLVFSVNINGVGVPPVSGTGIIAGDPESFFHTDSTLITVTQG